MKKVERANRRAGGLKGALKIAKKRSELKTELMIAKAKQSGEPFRNPFIEKRDPVTGKGARLHTKAELRNAVKIVEG